jgi:hypothetical protein
LDDLVGTRVTGALVPLNINGFQIGNATGYKYWRQYLMSSTKGSEHEAADPTLPRHPVARVRGAAHSTVH